MVLSYAYTPPRWIARVDPLDVKGFQLTLMFDESRMEVPVLVTKKPFNNVTISHPSFGVVRVMANTDVTAAGDVDIFELVFSDLSAPSPNAPIENVPFTVFACSGDFINALDTDHAPQIVRFGPAEIGSTTRSVTTGVSPHIWDPDGEYNSPNGHIGGSGTWQNLSLVSWDDLPSASPTTPPPFSDTPWDNNTHGNDVAIFGGNPDSGDVTVCGPISVGGFQFDISGYNILGGVAGAGGCTTDGALTLSAPGLAPIVDTGANNAMISTPISGNSGLTKIGTGTLALTRANAYTGATTINAGTLQLDFSATGAPPINILDSTSTLTLGSGTFNLTGKPGAPNSGQMLGGLTINAGSSAITATQNGAANLSLALGAIGRTVGGTLDFTLPLSGSISTAASNTNGILGGYATVSGNTWASVVAGNIAGLTPASYSNSFSTDNVNLDVPNGGGTLIANPNSIRFNDAHPDTVTVSGIHSIFSGGILVTGNVGANLSTINGGILEGASGQDLVVIQNNTSNRLTIGSIIIDNPPATGLTKSGPGVLALMNANNYTGNTLVNAGTLLVNNPGGTGNGAVMVNNSGCVLGGTGGISGPVDVSRGAAILGGDGTSTNGALTVANNLTLKFGSIIKLALGPSNTHSTLNRTGGTWTFAPNQTFTFINVGGAQPGFYNNIITGLAADPGTEACWTVTNTEFVATFVYDNPGGAGNIDLNITTPLTPTSVVSRKTHGAAGTFDINLPLTGPVGVECRNSGGNQMLVITFNNSIVGGNASVTSGTGSVSGPPAFAGNVMTVNLTGVTNAQAITVTLSGVTDGIQVLPDTAVSMRVLVGDTSGNGSVNGTDVSLTKSQAGATANSGNFRADVVPNGTINATDVSVVKISSGTSLPKPAK